MPDLSLVWFTIDDQQASLDRDQVRAISERLGLSTRMFSRDSKVRAFRQACQLRHEFTADDGARHTIRAKILEQRGTEFITAVMLREDDFKMGEFKFFQAVKQRSGIPQGAVVLRHNVRTTMPATDRDAARAWVSAAEQTFAGSSDNAQLPSIRRQVRMSVLRVGVPIVGRESMYFVYDDDMEVIHATRQFVAEVCPGTPFWVIGVDDSAELGVFAVSADEQLEQDVQGLAARIERAASPDGRSIAASRHDRYMSQLAALRRRQARHERRLRLPLPRTGSSLLLAQDLLSRFPPRDSLPTVTRR